MPFLIYKKTIAADRIGYERFQPLKLAGTDGLIARHVRSLAAQETESWKLGPAALLQLAGCGQGQCTVLFDATGRGATSVCLYELLQVHGSCRDASTQLALDFTIVIDQEVGGDAAGFVKRFEVPHPAKPRQLGETLALTGGPGGGDWKWAETAMNLGVTIAHASSAHSHGNGKPCPNCSCKTP